MDWSALAEMHLLLREHGWEAEYIPEWGFDDGTLGEPSYWQWEHPGQKYSISTSLNLWVGITKPGWRVNRRRRRNERFEDTFSVAALRRKLKQFDSAATQK